MNYLKNLNVTKKIKNSEELSVSMVEEFKKNKAVKMLKLVKK